MPSMRHEGLLLLFRNRPRLAAELLEVTGVALPAFTDARIASAELTEIVPAEYRADLVVVLTHGGPMVQALIVEVQLRRDPAKRKTWPLYLSGSYARLGCPTKLVVIAPTSPVARWCAEPIELGHPGFVLRPIVMGPTAVPVITGRREAARHPELAVLSAMSHGREEIAVEVARAALGATHGLDEERTRLYADLVMSSLGEAARKALEALMHSGTYVYQSDFARKYVGQGRQEGLKEGLEKGRQEGRQEGEAEAILEVLAARGLETSATARKRILGCSDSAQLRDWLRKSVTVEKATQLFAPSTKGTATRSKRVRKPTPSGANRRKSPRR